MIFKALQWTGKYMNILKRSRYIVRENRNSCFIKLILLNLWDIRKKITIKHPQSP